MSVISIQHAVGVTKGDGDTLTLPSPATAGNVVIVYGVHSYPGCPPSISNSESSTVTARIAETSSSNGLIRVATMVVMATGTYTITAHMACGFFKLLFVEEVSGADLTAPIGSSYDTHETSSTSTLVLGGVTASAGAGLRAFTYRGINAYTPTSGWTAPLENDSTNVYLVQGTVQASSGSAGCTIGLSNPGGGGSPVVGLLFSITAAAVTNTISVTTQPASTVSGAPFSPAVVVTSSDLTDNSTVVTIAVVGSGTTLTGTLSRTMASGAATFTGAGPTGPGTARHLHVTAPGYTAIDSADFTVTAPATAPIPLPLLFGAN